MTNKDNTRASEAAKEKITIAVYYGPARKILSMESLNLMPQDASELIRTIEVLVLGYPEAHKLEQPENVINPEASND